VVAHTPPDFAILCVGRTGSEHLVALLDSHPDVTCHTELFAPKWSLQGFRPPARATEFASSRHDNVWDYWSEVAAGTGSRRIGLKLPNSSIDKHPAAAELISSAEVKLIRMRRRDRFAQYVSGQLAARTGIWYATDEGYPDDARLELDPRRCRIGLERLRRVEAKLDGLAEGHQVFSLDYEELGSPQRLEALQAFLAVEPQALHSPYRRLRRRSLDKVVVNMDQLRAQLGDLLGPD
jgi:hypothetical protein